MAGRMDGKKAVVVGGGSAAEQADGYRSSHFGGLRPRGSRGLRRRFFPRPGRSYRESDRRCRW